MKLSREAVLVTSLLSPVCSRFIAPLGAGCRHLRNEQEQETSHDCSNKILCLRTR